MKTLPMAARGEAFAADMRVAGTLSFECALPGGERPVADHCVPDARVAAGASLNEVEPGHVLDGRFEILNVINRGGMACIYKALDRQTGKLVALKLPSAQFEADPGYYSRFQREENIGLTLNHPCVVRILATGPEKSRPYIAMEFLEGWTLATHLREHSPVPESEAVRIASQLCAGLDYLHRNGIVHRDLKPENVMLCRDGTIRIMDFGIAKSDHCKRLTFGGFSAALGTPDYIAPEQVAGKRGDSRTDIYALGAMLYEMTTGAPPYEGDNALVVMNARLTGDPVPPRERNPALSAQIEEIILHALERNPARRLSSAASMRAELNHYAEVKLTDRFKKLRQAQPWKTGLPLWAKLALLGVAQILACFLFYWCFSHHSRAANPAAVPAPVGIEQKSGAD